MRAGLFGAAGNPAYKAAAAGLEALGFEVVGQVPSCWLRSQAERNLAAVVVCGMRDRCADVVDHYGSAGVPVALVELPHLRGDGGAGQLRVTPPSHTWLPSFSGDAPTDRLDRLGIEIKKRQRVKGQAVLLCGQRSGDSAHGMDGATARRWAQETLATIRSLSDSKVIWRPHPRDPWRLEGVDGYSDPAEPLASALDRAWLVVTYNSTAGIEALIAGLPVVAQGPAVYSHLAGRLNQWSKIAPPDLAELRRLLAALAYTQWTPEEIETGLPLSLALSNAVLMGVEREEPASAPPAAPPAIEEPAEVIEEPAALAAVDEAPPQAPAAQAPAEPPPLSPPVDHARKASPAPTASPKNTKSHRKGATAKK